jgi:hypothetical protein
MIPRAKNIKISAKRMRIVQLAMTTAASASTKSVKQNNK